MSNSLTTDRRSTRLREDLTPRELLDAQVRSAQCQLAQAREALIAARRRVVELENAVANWIELSQMAPLTPNRSN